MVLKIINADQSHSRDIWEWRNNPITRSVSRKTDKVDWNNHKEWFKKSLDNNRIFLYIGINKESQKNIPIGILTADCVPILICDERKNLIAAIHAGWKGAYKDIINKVIKPMLTKISVNITKEVSIIFLTNNIQP